MALEHLVHLREVDETPGQVIIEGSAITPFAKSPSSRVSVRGDHIPARVAGSARSSATRLLALGSLALI